MGFVCGWACGFCVRVGFMCVWDSGFCVGGMVGFLYVGVLDVCELVCMGELCE